jgi:hypothetical protein
MPLHAPVACLEPGVLSPAVTTQVSTLTETISYEQGREWFVMRT